MNQIHLKSERLDIKPIEISDLEAIHQLLSLPETDKFKALGTTLERRKRQHLPLKTGWSDNFGYAILSSDLKNTIKKN